jgi:hypothetical protein
MSLKRVAVFWTLIVVRVVFSFLEVSEIGPVSFFRGQHYVRNPASYSHLVLEVQYEDRLRWLAHQIRLIAW